MLFNPFTLFNAVKRCSTLFERGGVVTDRIHRVLDGDLAAGTLSPAEAAELDVQEEAVRRALSGVRSEATPDVTAGVMSRVAALPRHRPSGTSSDSRVQRLWQRVWQPRPITIGLRPAWGLVAAAAALALYVTAPAWNAGPSATPVEPVATSATPAGPPVVLVQFRIEAPDAQQVQLAGDFTEWQPSHSLIRADDGVWTIIVPVSAGVHQYAFVVDGERWVADPLAPQVDDGFGGSNSRLDVVATSARGS